MKKKNIFFMLILLTLFGTICNNVFAANGLEWWDKSTNWYAGGGTNVGIGSGMLDGISNLLEIVGTAVIAIATVVIGAKYMLGTVQGKVEAKENLITLLVACFFFFGWTSIRGLLITGNATGANGINGSTQLVIFNGDLQSTFSQIFTFVVTISKLLCVFAILYMGVKYIFAGANAKAQLKEKSPAMIIGIILIFCAVNVVGFIANMVTAI